jgi:hypothetical protein
MTEQKSASSYRRHFSSVLDAARARTCPRAIQHAAGKKRKNHQNGGIYLSMVDQNYVFTKHTKQQYA